jgi:hypothetical protein
MPRIVLSPLSLIHRFVLGVLFCNILVEGDRSYDYLSTRGGNKNNMATATPSISDNVATRVESKTTMVDIVFSDLDGTLIHYPTNSDDNIKKDYSRDICRLPPSSTGMVGVISSETLRLVRDIRRTGVKFVLVSGMRSSTLLKRTPYLPKADAYCCEDGGRIFYPIPRAIGTFAVHPKTFVSAHDNDLESFSLVEDMEWRTKMEHVDAAGKDGYVGQHLNSSLQVDECPSQISERVGRLWSFARFLEERGFVVDTKDYSTCFRVNKQQQKDTTDFDLLLNEVIDDLPPGLSTSANLGCIDVYPSLSGKKNWYV